MLSLIGLILAGGIKMDELYQSEDDWEPPLEFEEIELPDWPIEAFPEFPRKFISELSRSTETPHELSSMMFLSAIAAVSQKKYEVEIREGYRETVNIWTSSSLPPASRKTTVFSVLTKPIICSENEINEKLKSLLMNQSSRKKTLEERIKHLRRKAAREENAESFDAIQTEVESLEEKLDEIASFPRLWTSDITPEQLGVMMAANEGSMAIFSDEGGVFDIMGGIYSKGKANIDLLLQSHSAGSVRVDRGSRPPVSIEKALLTIGLTVQPEVIKQACKNETFRGRGLLARFLFVFPKSNIGCRNLEEPPMDNFLKDHYNALIRKILDHPYDLTFSKPKPHVLKMDQQAYKIWLDCAKVIEKKMGPEIDCLSNITDWAGKLSGQIVRIAALLHISRYAFEKPWEKIISVEDMEGAIKIGQTLIFHALKTFDLVQDSNESKAKEVLNWVSEYRFQTFTQRECLRRFRKYKKNDLKPGLELLEQRGYIHRCPSSQKKGAPTVCFIVNPWFIKSISGQQGQWGQ